MKIATVISDPMSGNLLYPVCTAVALKQLGHAVTALTWTLDKAQTAGLLEQLDAYGIPVRMIPTLDSPACLRSFLTALRTLGPARRESGYDLILSTGPYVTWQLRLVFKDGLFATVVNAMGHDRRSSFKPKLGAFLLNRFSDVVVALCEAEQARIEYFGVKPNRITVIPNPVDTDRILRFSEKVLSAGRIGFLEKLNLDPDRKYIACLASFQTRKRQDILINAFSKLAPFFPRYNVVFAGEGQEMDRCKSLVASLGLENRIHFLGDLDNEVAIGLIACADCIAHCSSAETFGYSMVEPLLLEKPAVFTRIGIGIEIERADIAEVVPTDDLNAFTLGLRRVLAGGPDIEGRLRRGRAFVEDNFGVRRIAAQLVGLTRFRDCRKTQH